MVGSEVVAAVGVLAPGRLDVLVQQLRLRGYTVYAPVLERGSLAIRPITSAADLPRGILDDAEPGAHRLRKSGDRYFDYTVPADSWKRLFFPPRLRLWSAAVKDGGVETSRGTAPGGPVALLGVRGCDLRAIEIQDRVFLGGEHPDAHYLARREGAFIVAVNCARATSTCFCTSMQSGPDARSGHDLALTELRDGRFLVQAAGDRGAELLAELPVAPAEGEDVAQAAQIVEATAASITRTMPAGIPATLAAAKESPRWQSIADRCLACGNCTMVCPTCFCTAIEHTTELDGAVHHDRRWDSCFNSSHSYIHGGSVRRSTFKLHRSA